MVDSAMLYLTGTLYPLLARATYPTLHFPQYPGEVATSAADDALKAQAQKDAEEAIAEPLEVYRAGSSTGSGSSAATAPPSPTSGWRPRSSSCARSTTRSRTGRRSTCAGSRSALGDAYSEPAADVRGFVASVKEG